MNRKSAKLMNWKLNMCAEETGIEYRAAVNK